MTRSAVILALALLVVGNVLAVERAVQDIRVARENNVAKLEIVPGCPMRYLTHNATGDGTELRIRLSLTGECRRALGGVANEVYRPVSAALAQVSEVEFDSVGAWEALLTVRFDQPSAFKVAQTGAFGWITVRVDTTATDPTRGTAEIAPPVPKPEIEAPTVRRAPPASSRTPLRRRDRSVAEAERYSIQLGAFDSEEAARSSGPVLAPGQQAYLIETLVRGRPQWTVQVGFFTAEADAEAAIAALAADYPNSWARVVTDEEYADAQRQQAEGTEQVEALPAPVASGARTLTDADVSSAMDEARAALVAEDYDEAVALYTRVLEQPDHTDRLRAREYLGVAHERAGNFAAAKSEYQAYLAESSEGVDADRVQQRLTALVTADDVQRVPLRVARRQTGNWQFAGGLSQYYSRGVIQLPQVEEDVVSQSALQSYGDLLVMRQGERFGLIGRFNGAYHHDLVPENEGPGNQGLISYAYLDVNDERWNWSARLGRQTQYDSGVLGRFDGAHMSYRYRPDLKFNVTAGYPVDSPRYATSTRRQFYGASANLDNWRDAWNFSLFTQQQTVDGLLDRQAVGGEAQYQTSNFNVISLIDFDTSYSVLNSALVNGNWRATDRLTLSGLVDFGARPYLTTRNALIGQPERTIEALGLRFSEGQLRTLARNRTAQSVSYSLGGDFTFSERFELHLDATIIDADETVQSGGVVGLPDLGAQTYLSASVLATSFFRDRDFTQLTFRQDTNDIYESVGITFDTRLPMSDALRINPRLSVALRDNLGDGSEQVIATPALRILYRWRRNYLFELELGGRWSSRDLPATFIDPFLPDGTEEISSYFVNLGYRAEF